MNIDIPPPGIHGLACKNSLVSHTIIEHIEAEWGIYALAIYVFIGTDDGLSPDRRQAIIWTNATLLFLKPMRINSSEIWSKNTMIFIKNY